jgi:hypothetical protein
MNRRSFLVYAAFSAIAVGAGGYIFYTMIRELQWFKKTRSLYHVTFKDIAYDTDLDSIYAILTDKGVIDENNNLNIQVVIALAKTDPVIGYNGRYYTQTELELYSFSYLIHKKYEPIRWLIAQ